MSGQTPERLRELAEAFQDEKLTPRMSMEIYEILTEQAARLEREARAKKWLRGLSGGDVDGSGENFY